MFLSNYLTFPSVINVASYLAFMKKVWMVVKNISVKEPLCLQLFGSKDDQVGKRTCKRSSMVGDAQDIVISRESPILFQKL